MFHLRRFSSRFAASAAAASASAAFALSTTKFPVRAEDPAPGAEQLFSTSTKRKPTPKETSLTEFDLFSSYQVHIGKSAEKAPLTKADVGEVLLGCGILDPEMSTFFFNALVAMDLRKKREAKNKSQKKEKKGLYANPDALPTTASYSSFLKLCHTFYKGDDIAKWNIMFDFLDLDKSGNCDKNGCSITVRHLLWCQTNWYGEEVLYDGPHDLDLYFNVPTEAIAQLKANKFAHEMVMACHGGGRSLQMNRKQFGQFMMTGGRNVEVLKGLFSVFGAYPPLEFNKDYDDE